MGKRPVRSVDATPAIWLVEITPAIQTWWVLVASVFWSGKYASLYVPDLTILGFTGAAGRSLVNRTFFLVMCRHPMAVGTYFSRFLATILAVRPSHVENQPLLMAWFQVTGRDIPGTWVNVSRETGQSLLAVCTVGPMFAYSRWLAF